MAITQGKNLVAWFRKYRYPMIILLVGFVLMLISGKVDKKGTEIQASEPKVQTDVTVQLKHILAQIDGVGKVDLMLSISAGEKTIYQTDENHSNGSIRTETVIITDSNRNQQALVLQVEPVAYRGAIIVCQGADDPKTKLAIVEAVSRLTGLGADCICVLKMK